MVIVHGMRILTDLSFYYAFASFVAACYGGKYAIVGLLLQTGCFMLSAALGLCNSAYAATIQVSKPKISAQ